MNNNEVKDDYSYWSENLHSSYLFYTMEVDKLNKLNKQLTQKLEKARGALKQIIVNDQRRQEKDLTPTSLARLALKELE